MAYNKREKLHYNINAIKKVYELSGNKNLTEEDKTVLRKYSGFGGLKFVLNKIEDKETWKESDKPYFDKTKELFDFIQESTNPIESAIVISSIRNSVLSSFYTPEEIVSAIAKAVKDSGINVKKFLDPSSGGGVFVDKFQEQYPDVHVTAFEKDLLTGKILSALHVADGSDILVKGYETIESDVKDFDVIASNIPFGEFNIFDPQYNGRFPVHKLARSRIHDYFFVKSLDKVRNGGLVAFITSRGVLDSPSNEPVRRHIAERANIVSVVRLPDGMFSDTAGTEVGSDLVIFQKNNDKQGLTSRDNLFIRLEDRYSENGEHTVINALVSSNNYIASKVVWGTNAYCTPTLLYTYDGTVNELAQELSKNLSVDLLNYLDKDLYGQDIKDESMVVTLTKNPTKEQGQSAQKPVQLSLFDMFDEIVESASDDMEPRVYSGKILIHYRDGLVVQDGEQLGILSAVKSGNPIFEPRKFDNHAEARLRLYIPVRDAYEQLYIYEDDERHEFPGLRYELNRSYDAFVQKFGHLNGRSNSRALLLDVLGRDMQSIEVANPDGKTFRKSDIFERPVYYVEPTVEHIEDPNEALSISLNKFGTVDLNYMSELTGIEVTELRKQLGDAIYYNAEGEYEIASKFLSGNIIEKIESFPSFIIEDDVLNVEEVRHSLAALERVKPIPIPFEDLDLNFGERWMPKEYFSEFASKLFDVEVNIDFATRLDEYVIKHNGYSSIANNEFAVTGETQSYDGFELMRHALYNTVPTIQKIIGYNPDGKNIMGPDHEKIQLAASKIDQIREAFSEWVNEHPKEWKDSLAAMYNHRFNCFVRAKYDGSHQEFPGLDLTALAKSKYRISDVYKSQKDCVWMLLQNGGGICDHEVGTGKTLIMCLAAHEMKRLGLAHKIVIIGMKANVAEIAATYQTAYPGDKVLYASSKDFKDRDIFFNRIKNNDYDCIIMSHDQFTAIPQSAEIQRIVLQEELEAIDEALEVYKNTGGHVSGKMLSGLEVRKQNLEVELANVNYSLSKRAEDVVDFKTMGIDHIFVDESQVFKNLAFTTRDKRVAGLGDPKGSQRARNLQYAIRTIQERTGKDLGATFLSGTTISNSLTELYLLFKYLRPKALSKQGINSFDAWAAVFARKSRDYEINVAGSIVMKERFRHFIKVPELAAFYNEITDYRTANDVGLDRPDMSVKLVNLEPTEAHKDFSQRLLQFAQSGDGSLVFRSDLSDNEQKAKMLLVTNMGKKASLSPKLVNKDYEEGDHTKIGVAASNIAEYYRKYDEYKGTQFVFCDLSTPKKDEWNAYQELKDRLVNQYGIPAEEIGFIQDAGTEKKKQEYIAKMNRGDIRVMVGSTTMLGTGVNAQERAVAIHHLDLPWRPSDMEQRNGRARRKGNEVARLYANNNVDCFVYAVERSLDSYNFYLLQAKSEFIRQMKTGSLAKRSFDQGGEDEDNGMPFAEFVAITSGNNDLLERAKLEKRILGLESEKKAFLAEQRHVEARLAYSRTELERSENILVKLREDFQTLEVNSEKDNENKYINAFHLNGYPGYHTEEEKGSFLQDQVRRLITEEVEIGHIYGFPVIMRPKDVNFEGKRIGNQVIVKGNFNYTHSDGFVNMSSRVAAAAYAMTAIIKIPSMIEHYEKDIARYKRDIPELERISGKQWDKTVQLSDLKEQLVALDRKIQQDIDINTMAAASQKDEAPFKIEQKNWGRQPWELTFKVSDYPFVSIVDARAVADKYHGSFHVYGETMQGNFRHQYGAQESIKELTKLNTDRREDIEWLKATAQRSNDNALRAAAIKQLRSKGLDRFGNSLILFDKPNSMSVIALADYTDVRLLAHGVKEGHTGSLQTAASAIAQVIKNIPESSNAVLVPMPGHNGDARQMSKLTDLVERITGIESVEVLQGTPREELYQWKKEHPGEELPEVFFMQDEDLRSKFEGKIPILIDNVLDTGHTAWAAMEALEKTPVLVTLGTTGNNNIEGHRFDVKVSEQGLHYINEARPEGVGFTGMSQEEFDSLIARAKDSDAGASQNMHHARRMLRNAGYDYHTGRPSFEVASIIGKWDYAYDDILIPAMKDVRDKIAHDELFTAAEKRFVPQEKIDTLVARMEESFIAPDEDFIGFRKINAIKNVFIDYEVMKMDAALAVQQEKKGLNEEVLDNRGDLYEYIARISEEDSKKILDMLYSRGSDEVRSIIFQAEQNDQLLKAPNGEPTQLSPVQWVFVRTEQFRNFFGESKALNEDLEPLSLFHGTVSHDFSTFRNEGSGIYFTPDKGAAQTYGANDMNPYQVFVKMNNPMEIDFDGDIDTEETDTHYSLEDEYMKAVELNYDGVIAYNTFDGENEMDQYVIKNPENIMLADDRHLLERMGISSEQAKEVPGLAKMDEEYLQAVMSKDMSKAERMVREAADRAGYKDSESSYQGSTDQFGAAPVDDYGYSQQERMELWENGDLDGNITLEDMTYGISISGEDEYITSNRSTFRLDDMRKQAVGNLRDAVNRSIQEGNNTTITVYRVVPKDIVEQQLRVGDWVSPSSDYAVHTGNIRYGEGNYNIIKQEVNIKHLWWDGNDIVEWGYDDNSEKNVYQNVENNRKTLATVTYDDNNNIIPLSKRFDVNNSDIRFQKKIEDPSSNISFVVTQTMTNGMGHFAVEFDNKIDFLRYASLDEINTAAKTYDALVSVTPSANNKIIIFDIQTAEEARDLGNELRSFLARRMNQNDYEVIDTRGMQEDNNFVVDFGFRRNLTENISVEEIDSIGNEYDALVIHYPFQNNRIEAYDFRSEADARQFGDHITALYEERQKQKEYQAKPVESSLRDALVERMRNAGIKVSTDRTEAIAVLESVNGNIQMSKLTGVAPLVSSTDDNVMRRNLLARPISQQEIDTAKNSNLLKSWSRYNVPNSGVRIFGPVSPMLRTLAKACLGIDSKYDINSLFWDPYDYIGDIVDIAKENGLKGAVAEKIDWKNKEQAHDAIRNGNEKGEPVYTESEVDEICRHLPESLAYQFRECVYVASQEKNIQNEIKRITAYDNGAAVSQAFVLYDIATRRMREQYGHYENDYYKKNYVLVTPDGERHHNPGWKTPEDVRLKKNEPIGENDRIEVEYSLRAKVSESLLTAIATMPIVQEILGVENKDQGIESLNFKNWFGDWQNDSENASKVVSWNEENERVEPTVVYHGTRNGFFPVFDKDMIGSSWNADDEGFFFTESKILGEDYTKPVYNGQSGEPHLFDVYLDIKKPLVIDRKWYAANYNNRRISDHDAVEVWDDNREDILEAKKNGDYDGIIIDTTGYGATQPKMYVVFEPEQIKSASLNNGQWSKNNADIRYFRTSDGGQAYGFVHKGTIYLDPTVATAETAIHEYTHLWSEVLRQRNPEEWNNIVSLMKQEKELWHEIKMNYPELTTDDAIADEVLAHFSGRRSSVIETMKGVEKYGILDSIVEAINRFWKFVGDFFNIHYTSKEEVADKVFADLVKGVNPLDYAVKNDENIHLMKESTIINPIYTGLFVQDVPALADKYKPSLPVDYATHITQAFRPGEIDSSTLGLTRNVPIRGRLITDKVDVLLVDISDTNNEYPHITLATAEGVAPKESNSEIAKYLELREKFDQLDFEIQNDAPWDTNLSKEEYESHRVEYDQLKQELQKYQFTELEDYVTVKSGAFMGVQNINYGDYEKSEATPLDKLSLIYEILGGTSYEKEDVLKHIKDEKIKDLILKNDRLYNATVLGPEERKAARSEYFDSVQKLDQALSAYVGVNDINDVDELTKRYDELSAEADKDVEKELEYKHVITPASRLATETLVDILKNNTGINLIMNTQEEGQYVADKVNAYSVELMSISDKFDVELQQQIDGMLPEGHIYNMGMPSSKLLSCGIPYLPIQLNSTRLKIKSNDYDHNFELSEVKGLVKAINDPIAVFDYGKNNTARNIIVNIKHEGKNFLVGMFLNPNINGRYLEINSVRNVFPKDTNEWVNWIQQGKLLGGYTQKIQVEIDKRRINLADVKYLNLDLVANILKNGEYVKFQDIKNQENIEFMQRPDGIVYGWSVGNEIHITPEGMNPNTLVHEYTHLWAHAMLQNDSESWNTIKSTMQKTPMWQEVLSDREYQNIATNEDAITSEVLARLSGKNNAEKIVREADKMLSNGMTDSTETKESLIQKLSDSIGKFWGWVSENVFHIKAQYNHWRMDSMEISDRVLYDLLNKTDINIQAVRTTENVRLQKAIVPTKDIIDVVSADRSYYGLGEIIGKALEEKYGDTSSLHLSGVVRSNLENLSLLNYNVGMNFDEGKDVSPVSILVDDSRSPQTTLYKLEIAAAVKDMSHVMKNQEYAKAIILAGLVDDLHLHGGHFYFDDTLKLNMYHQIPKYLSLDADNTKTILEKYEVYNASDKNIGYLIDEYYSATHHNGISLAEVNKSINRNRETLKSFEEELFAYLGISSIEGSREQQARYSSYIKDLNESYGEALNDIQATIDGISKENYEKISDSLLRGNLVDSEGEEDLQAKVIERLRACGIEVVDDIAEGNRQLGTSPDVEKLITTEGERVYGFAKDGRIYVDNSIATAETPIHEYTHLWAEAMRQNNPQEWSRIADIMREDGNADWIDVLNEYPELKQQGNLSDDVIEEALSRYSGRYGHAKLLEDAEKLSEPKTFIQSMTEAINRFWSEVMVMLGVKERQQEMNTAADIADRILSDLMRGVNPNENLAEPRSEARFQKVGNTTVNKVTWQGTMDVYSSGGYLATRPLSLGVKREKEESIDEASKILIELVKRVPNHENAVLIPIPNRDGNAGYTLELANRIKENTGLEVADVLTGKPHKPMFDRKESRGNEDLRLMKYDTKADIPEGKKFILVDNVLDTGTTAMSAMRTLGDSASLVVIGSTTNSKKYNYPININVAPVITDKLTPSRVDNAQEALYDFYQAKYSAKGIGTDIAGVIRSVDPKDWNSLRATARKLEILLYSNSNIEDSEKQKLIEQGASEAVSAVVKEESLIRLAKDVRKVLNPANKEVTDGWIFPVRTIDNKDVLVDIPKEKEATLSVVLDDKTASLTSLSEADYNHIVSQLLAGVNEGLLSRNLSKILENNNKLRLSEPLTVTMASGEQRTMYAYNVQAQSSVIVFGEHVADVVGNKGVTLDNISVLDRNKAVDAVLRSTGLYHEKTLYADNYTVDSTTISTNREKIVGKEKSPILTEKEVSMLSQVVSDLETGNHLLGRHRPEGYKTFVNYVQGINLKVMEGEPLTDKEKAILLEEANNYQEKFVDLSSRLNVSETTVRKSLGMINEKELELIKVIDESEKKIEAAGYGKGYSEDLGIGLGEYRRIDYYFDDHYHELDFSDVNGERFKVEITELSGEYEINYKHKFSGVDSAFYEVSAEEWTKRLSQVLSESRSNQIATDKERQAANMVIVEDGIINLKNKKDMAEEKSNVLKEDYSKYKFAEGVKVESANVFKANVGFFAGKWVVTAVINGERKTAELKSDDITAYFMKNERGELLKAVSSKEIAAKYFGVEVNVKEDYSKYKFAEGVKVESANVFKANDGYFAGKWVVTAVIDGERKTAALKKEDITAYFERNEQGELLRLVTQKDLAAKYFSEQDKAKEEIKTSQDTGEVKEEREHKDYHDKIDQAEKEEEEKKEEEEEKMEEEPKKEEEVGEKAAMLIGALALATINDGMWLNKNGKVGIQLLPGHHLNGFNALLMAINSDKNNYKTNVYTTYANALKEGYPIKRGSESMPFTWYNWDKYCNKYDENNIIDKKTYEALPEKERDMYRVSCTKEIRPIFNIDQSLMGKNHPEIYKHFTEAQNYSAIVGSSEKEQIKQRLEYAREKKELAPDHVIGVTVGDKIELYGSDARIVAKVLDLNLEEFSSHEDLENKPLVKLSLPVNKMEEYMSAIIKNGTKISIASENELFCYKKYGKPEQIYEKLDKMINNLKEVDKHVKTTTLQDNCQFEDNKLVLSKRRTAPIGSSVTTAIERANDLYRNIAAYTGTEEKLNRAGNLDLISSDVNKYDRLVQELSTGVIMSRMGLPAVISRENQELVNYWQRELRENPMMTARLEKDVNNTVQVIEEIQEGRGKDINYGKMRGVAKNQNTGKSFTIIEDINKQATMENKHIVLVRDARAKSVDVILPEGASLDMNENISGMNKNRILSAIIKEHGEDTKVNWYNAGGELGLKRPNDYFAKKEITVAQLKQYTLVPITRIDVKEEIARTSNIQIQQASMIKDNKGEWAFYVRANNEKEPFVVHPDVKDTDKFFRSLNTDKFQSVVNELSVKYYNLVQQHPEMKIDVLMPKVENKELLERITQVSINKRKGSDETVLWATVDGKKMPPMAISKEDYQRFFLVSDQDAYKKNLAAKMIEASEKKEVTVETTKEKQPENVQVNSNNKDTTVTLSPMLKQFMDLKKKHPDALLLFRCGDFYETYMQDAEKSSKILSIVLTKSTKTKDPDGKPLAMAGFPHNALESYLPMLIRAGQRVAICDQLEDPRRQTSEQSADKSLVQQELKELVTPSPEIEKEEEENQSRGFHV